MAPIALIIGIVILVIINAILIYLFFRYRSLAQSCTGSPAATCPIYLCDDGTRAKTS